MSKEKIQIEMKDGKSIPLANLTQGDLPNVKLVDGEKQGKPVTRLTLKSEVISETATHKTERRIYKWATMPAVAMYDDTYGKDLDLLVKDTKKESVYSWAIGNMLIEHDKDHNGIVGGSDPEVTAQKASVKLIASLRSMGQNKAADEVEASLKKVESVKKGMKEHGSGSKQ
jgi:hypothetical protein